MSLLDIKPHQVSSSPLDKVFLIYGEPGTRKTSVAVGDIEHTLLLAFEVGYKFIPGVYAKNIMNWVTLKQILRELDNDNVREKFKTIAIDTIGLAYKACVNYICSQKGVEEIGKIPYGQGYSMAKNEFEKVINSIPQRGFGLIMVAHSDEVTDDNGISVKVDINKRPSSVIKGLADFILYSRKEQLDDKPEESTVYAYSEISKGHVEVKKRARFFPKRFEFTYENLIKGLEEAIKKQDEFFGTQSIEEADFKVFVEEKEVDLKALQDEVAALASSLFETAEKDITIKTIKELLPNVRITKTNRNHISALFALRERLTTLKKGLR